MSQLEEREDAEEKSCDDEREGGRGGGARLLYTPASEVEMNVRMCGYVASASARYATLGKRDGATEPATRETWGTQAQHSVREEWTRKIKQKRRRGGLSGWEGEGVRGALPARAAAFTKKNSAPLRCTVATREAKERMPSSNTKNVLVLRRASLRHCDAPAHFPRALEGACSAALCLVE